MARDTHIIHRVNLEIDVPDVRLANQLKDDSVRLLYNEILPKLEKYMDTLVPPEEHIQLNQLNINIENLSEENFEEEFTWSFLQAFHEKTETIVEPALLQKSHLNKEEDEEVAAKYSKERSVFESFLFFLETGRLPWWCERSGEELEEQSLSLTLTQLAPEYLDRVIRLLTNNTIALERLLNQFSLELFFQIIFTSIKDQSRFANEILPEKVIASLQNFVSWRRAEEHALSNLQQIFIKQIISMIIKRKSGFSDQQIEYIFDELFSEIASLDPINQLDLKSLFDEIRIELTSFSQDPTTWETEKTNGDFSRNETSQSSNSLKDSSIISKKINPFWPKENQDSDSQKTEPLKKGNTSGTQKKQQDSNFQRNEEVTEITQKEINKKSKKDIEAEDGIFLDNAGLVLLHPFFESLFGHFELLVNGQFKDSESQTMAVHLLHYLATKEELAPEYELLMEKFLCGWNLDQPIAREILLPRQMKDECETLLTAAISHWRSLGNTSPDGLREGFLQREGKLVINDFQDRLIVEKKAYDILLSTIPWGYSIFKLPWMEGVLYVEWQ
jgi:hypothetical protein